MPILSAARLLADLHDAHLIDLAPGTGSGYRARKDAVLLDPVELIAEQLGHGGNAP